jgi:hypothetical protein
VFLERLLALQRCLCAARSPGTNSVTARSSTTKVTVDWSCAHLSPTKRPAFSYFLVQVPVPHPPHPTLKAGHETQACFLRDDYPYASHRRTCHSSSCLSLPRALPSSVQVSVDLPRYLKHMDIRLRSSATSLALDARPTHCRAALYSPGHYIATRRARAPQCHAPTHSSGRATVRRASHVQVFCRRPDTSATLP